MNGDTYVLECVPYVVRVGEPLDRVGAVWHDVPDTLNERVWEEELAGATSNQQQLRESL